MEEWNMWKNEMEGKGQCVEKQENGWSNQEIDGGAGE